MLKIYLLFGVIFGGMITAFIHETKGVIHTLDKLVSGVYIILSIMAGLVMYLRYGLGYTFLLFGLFVGSIFIFSLIFTIAFRKAK